ncbi:MAG: polysaccharide deacetylase family protein, partial [Clostridiales bacterium]|nr:polysaccharide deacetylase family protein [Clostridiales bacterium]
MRKHVITRAAAWLLVASLFLGNGWSGLAQAGQTEDAAQRAEVITGVPALENEHSLIFEGEVTRDLLDSILALLDSILALLASHQAKAGFFLPAIQIAEDPALAQRIIAQGHWLGNYLLRGERHLEEMDPVKRINNIKRAQEVVQTASGVAPTYLRGNVSEYTDPVLEDLATAGVPYALLPSVYLNHTSFKAQPEANTFIARLAPGALVTFKIRQPLEASELPEPQVKPTGSLTPQATPGPKAEGAPTPTIDVDARMLDVIGWLLGAFSDNQASLVTPEALHQNQSSAFGQLLRQAEDTAGAANIVQSLRADSARAEVLSSGFTVNKEISLVLEGSASRQTMSNIAQLLESLGIQASFFVPALEAARMADQIQSLVTTGHGIGNYLYQGEKNAASMAQTDQVHSLLKAQRVFGQLGITPEFFKANVSPYDDALLQSAYAVGIRQAVAPGVYLNHSSFSSMEQASGYISRVPAGSIISIKLNQVLDASELPAPETKAIAPSPTPQASIQPVNDKSDPVEPPKPEGWTVEQRLMNILDWVTASLQKQDFAIVSLTQLQEDQNAPLAKKLADIMSEQDSRALAQGLQADSAQAALIRSGPDFSGTRSVSLVFEGTASPTALRAISQALNAQQAKSVFFIPGQSLPGLQDVLSELVRDGHQLGNYSMSGKRSGLSASATDQLTSLYRAQQIAQAIAGVTPELFRLNATPIHSDLLKAARAVGLQAGLSPLAYVNHSSFKTWEQALAYATNSLDGTIVSIKMNDFLDETELNVPTPTATPDSTVDTTLTPPPQTASESNLEEALVRVTQWLVDAYAQEGFAFRLPQQIAENQTIVYPEGTRNTLSQAPNKAAPLFATLVMRNSSAPAVETKTNPALAATVSLPALETITDDSPQAGIIASSPVLPREISLVVEAISDVAAVEAFSSALARLQVQATFFLPAQLLLTHPQTAELLLSDGHELGNYMLFGETAAHQRDIAWQAENLYRAQMILEELSGRRAQLYKGNLTEYSRELLQAASIAGIAYAVKPGSVLNQGSFKTREQAASYACRTMPGTVLS